MILVHPRGGSATNMLDLAREFQTEDVAYLAPQAAGNTWYPYSFLAPIEQNEPGISTINNDELAWIRELLQVKGQKSKVKL